MVSDGTATNYSWDFSGGAPDAAGQAPTVTFFPSDTAGTYQVTVTATNPSTGNAGSASTTIQVSGAPPPPAATTTAATTTAPPQSTTGTGATPSPPPPSPRHADDIDRDIDDDLELDGLRPGELVHLVHLDHIDDLDHRDDGRAGADHLHRGEYHLDSGRGAGPHEQHDEHDEHAEHAEHAEHDRTDDGQLGRPPPRRPGIQLDPPRRTRPPRRPRRPIVSPSSRAG